MIDLLYTLWNDWFIVHYLAEWLIHFTLIDYCTLLQIEVGLRFFLYIEYLIERVQIENSLNYTSSTFRAKVFRYVEEPSEQENFIEYFVAAKEFYRCNMSHKIKLVWNKILIMRNAYGYWLYLLVQSHWKVFITKLSSVEPAFVIPKKMLLAIW